MNKPLTQADPDEVWEPKAKELGLTVLELRSQIALADAILDQIISEENFQRKARKWFSLRLQNH